MTDFIGNELHLEDEVVFVNHSGNYLRRGIIKKILKTKLEVSLVEFPKSKTTVFPDSCIKINI